MVGFGRQGDHDIEGLVFQVIEGLGEVAGHVDAQFVHDRGHERIGKIGIGPAKAAAVDEDPIAVEPPHQASGHGRADLIEVAGEQHGAGLGHIHPRQCRAQIRVKRRRAVSRSVLTLPASRAWRIAEPSLWRARRPISSASILCGVALRMASK